MALWVRILMITADPAEVEPAAEAHRRQVDALARAGRLRAAGVLGDDEGYLEIFEAADRHEAEDTLRASPLVERGLAAWTLRPFRER